MLSRRQAAVLDELAELDELSFFGVDFSELPESAFFSAAGLSVDFSDDEPSPDDFSDDFSAVAAALLEPAAARLSFR
ncbi:MAG TPA: hypothetical protein VLR26_16630 [Frankiaceae bacterium]|nr:hypothetical protein [Frankiaceae bacterium]